MEIKKQEKEASVGEFMKISLEGFSWAENICQRVESLCAENDMVQNPGKYVNVVGEHFRKVIDTVVNDLCDHADDVLELFSELSFGHASVIKASGKKGEELDGRGLHEKSSTCICEETTFMEKLSLVHDSLPSVMENLGTGSKKDTSDDIFLTSTKLDRVFSIDDLLSEHGDGTKVHEISSVEIEENASVEKYADLRLAPEIHSVEVLNQVQLPSKSQFLNKKDISAGIHFETPTFGAESLNCSAKSFSDAAALDADVTTSISLAETNSFMTESIQTGGPSPFNSIYIVDIESDEISYLLDSDRSELAPKIRPKERENSMKYGIISYFAENLNSFRREEFGNSSIFSLKNEDLSEFEDVKLEDDFKAGKVEYDWDDVVKTEIALISSLAAKKDSSKKKLKKMFTSRWRPSSRRKESATSREDLHSQSSSDFDWELL